MSQFHAKHGRSIAISPDAKTARKKKRIGSNFVYSKRDVKPNEVVCFQITAVTQKPSKHPCVAAFTDEDPQEMPTRPKTSWHLCNGRISLAPQECREGALILLMYDIQERLVFLGVDGQLRAVASLFGLARDPRWLVVRMDGNVTEIQMHESPGNQWDSFVLNATRISTVFRDLRVYNRGAPGLQKPQLLFQTKSDPRITYTNEGRTAIIQGSVASGINLYSQRQVLLGEVISLKFSKVCFGTSLEIYAVSGDSSHDTPSRGHDQPIVVQLTHDETVRIVANETGMIVQGVRQFVQSSARFFPITPLWLRFFIKSMATHITVELEDPHKLPVRNSLIGDELVVKNRAYSSTDRESSLLCKICYATKMDTALQPCHHVSMCNACTRRVMDRVGWKCTVCGEAVTGVFSINLK